MKIVLCLNHFMPQKIAGTEVYTWALAKSLQQKGHLVTIVLPNYDTNVGNQYYYDGLLVRQYAEPNCIDAALQKGRRAPDGIDAFAELLEEIQPDLVNIQELAGSSGFGIFHLRVLKGMNIRTVLTMHLASYSCFCGTMMYRGKEHCSGLIDVKRCTRCALSKQPISPFTEQILYNVSVPLFSLGINTGKLNHPLATALSYPFIIQKLNDKLDEIAELCERFIVLTDWYKKVLLMNGIPEQKIQLIKQALPVTTADTPAKSKENTNTINLIFIGRIDPLKGLHLLLQAIEQLPEEKITLSIYGAVNDEEYHSNWKDATRAKKNVHWMGILPQHKIVYTITNYDALVLPSTFSEMSPLVIQEAFAAGVPVIGSDVAGIAEQVKHGVNGLLFNFNDHYSLQHVLNGVVSEPMILTSLRKQIAAPRSFEGVVEETIALYEQVVLDKELVG